MAGSLFDQLYFSTNPTIAIIISSILAAALLLYFPLFLWRSKRSSITSSSDKELREPPEPAASWPILGHLPHLLAGSKQLPHIFLGAMADKYGPAFVIRVGVHKALIVSSWEVVKECFTTNDGAWASRVKLIALEHMGFNHSLFGFAPYGPYWREMRKVVNQELLSNNRLDMLQHVWDSEINSSIKKLYQIWRNGGGTTSQPALLEMKQWFADLTLNIMVKLVAGKPGYFHEDRYTSKSPTTNIGDKVAEGARKYHQQFRDYFGLVGQFILGDALPFLRWLDLGGYEKKMIYIKRELGALMDEWLEGHKQKRLVPGGDHEEEKAGRESEDFLDVMMSVLEKKTMLLDYFDSDTINKSTCLVSVKFVVIGIIAGGSDTPMVILVWALTLLLNNPVTLKKAYDELDIHVGRERQVKEADMENLVYLQAIVKETMRLYSGPLTGLRVSTKDCVVSGYHIPAGTGLIVNLHKIHRDPRVWSDPLEFKPERFLTNHKDIDMKGNNFELLPFGAGRRMCPAASFAIRMVQLALVRTIHGFDFKLPNDVPTDTSESAGLTNLKATPLEVIIAPRLSLELYI
uniref:Putative cytochrome P450 n=1 Tax=Eschscholzia californica subsp. californica TaxID=222997 RepID=A0A2Z6BXY4_ESCCA|nr:putative cytochrome P450 [Eschscholzia californica subsp. californica]